VRLDDEKPDVKQHHREPNEHAGELRDEQAGIGHTVAHSPRPIREDDSRAIESKSYLRQKGDGGDTGRGTETLSAVPQEQPCAQRAEYEPWGQDGDDEMPGPDNTECHVNAKGTGKQNPAKAAQKPANPTPRWIPQNEPAKSHVHSKKRKNANVIGGKGRSPVRENSQKGTEHRSNHLQPDGDGKPSYPLHSLVLNSEHQQRHRIDSE